MAIYELSKSDLNSYFKKCIEKSEYEFEITSEEMAQLFIADTSGYVNDNNAKKVINWPYEDGVHLFGIPIRINAFPYYMQDRETMRFSEITILSLLEYYSNTYNDYRTTMPSDIVYYKEKHIHERTLPSRGITYHTLTKILSEFGFSPRLYNVDAMERQNYSGMTKEDDIKRIMHYYIESGIPVAINVEPIDQAKSGHSLICIGHASKRNENIALSRKKYIGRNMDNRYSIVNSADYYDDYVVMDDNQFPYQIRNHKQLSIYSDMKITNLSVPLYKRMFLEATDAYDIFIEILESEYWGVEMWADAFLEEHSEIVTRMFLASTRSYKEFRVKSNSNNKEWMIYYGNLRMPRFIWICELYTIEGYNNLLPFGEIVLDATSASKKGIDNVILMNYPGRLYARNPDQSSFDIEENKFIPKEKCVLNAYNRNLFPVKNRT